MGEAIVKVPFGEELDGAQWRTFLIAIGPDDTADTIRNRVNEAVEDYINSETPISDQQLDIDPLIDAFGNIPYTVEFSEVIE